VNVRTVASIVFLVLDMRCISIGFVMYVCIIQAIILNIRDPHMSECICEMYGDRL